MQINPSQASAGVAYSADAQRALMDALVSSSVEDQTQMALRMAKLEISAVGSNLDISV